MEDIGYPDTKQGKIDLVKQIHIEVLKELGPEIAPHINRKKICELIIDRLPRKPIYDETTIYLILNGTYK